MLRSSKAFIDRLTASQESVEAFNNHLVANGHNARVIPLYVRPDVGKRISYADNGDIEITRDDGRKVYVDVKCTTKATFTGRADFPYQAILIGRVRRWDQYDPYPKWVAVLSSNYQYAGIVDTATKPKWYTMELETPTSIYGRTRMYMCPVNLATFIRLEK